MSVLSEIGKSALETGTQMNGKGVEFPNPWERPEGTQSGMKNEVGTPELQPQKTEFPNPWERPEGAESGMRGDVDTSELQPKGTEFSNPWERPEETSWRNSPGLLDNIAQEFNKRDVPNSIENAHFKEEPDHYYLDADGFQKPYYDDTPSYEWTPEDVSRLTPEEVIDLLNDYPDKSEGSPMGELAKELNNRDLPSPYNEAPRHDIGNGETRFYYDGKDAYDAFGKDFAKDPEFPDKNGNFPKGGKVEALTNVLNSSLNEGETPFTTQDVYKRFLEPLTEKSPIVARLEEILSA